MGKPKAPKPADPKVTGAAQTATNIGTAIAQQNLNNVNQVTPEGSLTYNQTGSYRYVDPLDGKTHTIPTYTATQSLSPEQQAISDQNNRASLNTARLGADQSARLNNILGRPVGTNSLPARGEVNSIRQTNLQRVGYGPGLQTELGNVGQVQRQVANSGAIQRTLGNAGPIGGVGAGPSLNKSIAGAGSINRRIGNAGDVQRVGGGPNLLDQIADSGSVQRTLGGAGAITRSYGTDFSQDRQRVEDALMDRMNPRLEQDRERLESRLASQGIRVGSEAYNSAMDDYGRQTNDARLGAILNAGQEQSRLTGLEAQRAGFENSAQAQAFDQLVQRGAFSNQAQQQQFGQNERRAGFTNASRQQEYQNQIGAAQHNNAAQSQLFNQLAQRTAVFNQAQQQRFNQNAARATFGNDARNREYDNTLKGVGFNNAAQSQRFNQLAQRGTFANQAQQQQFGQNAANAQLANNAQAQAFQQTAARAGFRNDGLQQMHQNRTQGISMGNQAAVQETNADIARFNAANNARNSAMQEQFALRNQPINEITALMSGSQVQNPNFITPNTAQLATTDFAGIQADYDNLRQRQYEQQMAQRNSLFGGVLGFGAALLPRRS